MFPSFILAIYYPQVGVVAGLLGSLATMFVIYIMPIVTYLTYKWQAINNPKRMQNLIENEEVTRDKSITDIKQLNEEISSEKNGFYMLCIVGGIIMCYGVLIFVLNMISFVSSFTSN